MEQRIGMKQYMHKVTGNGYKKINGLESGFTNKLSNF